MRAGPVLPPSGDDAPRLSLTSQSPASLHAYYGHHGAGSRDPHVPLGVPGITLLPKVTLSPVGRKEQCDGSLTDLVEQAAGHNETNGQEVGEP